MKIFWFRLIVFGYISVAATGSDAEEAITNESHRDFVIRTLIPSTKYCGYQHTDDRFYNESDTALDEFPWLVYILYDPRYYRRFFNDRCSGALISRRYVLTNDNCGIYAEKVLLGQYESEKNVSCISDPLFPECTEPSLVVGIESITKRQNTNLANLMIILLRLAEEAEYSGYVRPICLPFKESIQSVHNGTLMISGWGTKGPLKIIKKRLSYAVTDVNVCYSRNGYLNPDYSFDTGKVNYTCLLPKVKDAGSACTGDSGGPLMYKYRNQWYIGGVVSLVYTSSEEWCSHSDPIDAAKITSGVIDWILEQMRA